MTFTVYGTPAPQGSKRGFVTKRGRVAMVESSKAVKPWREAVAQAVMLYHPLGGRPDPILCRGPVEVAIAFTLKAPKKRQSYPAVKPDIDKLIRSTLDALTQMGVFEDDARVVKIQAWKTYPGGMGSLSVPGAIISVRALTGAEERKAG